MTQCKDGGTSFWKEKKNASGGAPLQRKSTMTMVVYNIADYAVNVDSYEVLVHHFVPEAAL